MSARVTTQRLALDLCPPRDSSFWPAYVAIRADPSWQQQVWHATYPPENPRRVYERNSTLVDRRGHGIWAVSKRHSDATVVNHSGGDDRATEWVGWIGYRNLDDASPQSAKWPPPPGTLEVYIGFSREHWGNGYGTEALKGLVDDAFSKHLVKGRLTACILEDNPASERCFEAAGFLRTSEDLRYEDEGGYWVLGREEWEKRKDP
ncbi:hypothetical protein JX266_006420 [Neoarthrinium moseri]|uniref:uncharacterized protein n=1 Tax=Neoarthrinium moseri TaxID=1658444 RepID=UPI001FDC2082|nr:uncharacterized protein JN550_007075 [Neoarthrinium moseri]KAI1847568.1 hypothetical protein JX266_006420 [Neoarthrinium moseri]KAI1867344.1 hypothetical protein JN550_007075 [Neoarthrinium moseri]